MHRVFLSYRRDDTQFVSSRLCELLESRRAFGPGSVFIDTDHIPPGVDFRQVIDEAVGRCEFFLAVIGKRWAERLSDPNDWVRVEIEAALRRDIPVTPVLVDGATLPPSEQLPTSLHPLLYKQTAVVRPGKQTRADVDVLVAGLRQSAERLRHRSPPDTPRAAAPSRWRLFRWFARRRPAPPPTVTCPFCLEGIPATGRLLDCPRPECGQPWPPNYDRAGLRMPPLFVPLIGYSGCGKTVWMNAMVATLERMPVVWPGFFIRPLTDGTDYWLRGVRMDLDRLRVPAATPAILPYPYVFALENLRRWRDDARIGRTLLIRDLAGEAFMSGVTIPEDTARLLVRSRVVMMMFALSDLEDPTRNSSQSGVFDLMNRYVTGMEAAGVDLRERRPTVVVVLSKGDQFVAERFGWPDGLIEYLRSDPLRAALERGAGDPMSDAALDEYLRRMAATSDEIRDHMLARPRQQASVRALLALAESRGIRVRFTTTSALGHEPDQANQRLRMPAVPCRVLDPLFTALEMGA